MREERDDMTLEEKRMMRRSAHRTHRPKQEDQRPESEEIKPEHLAEHTVVAGDTLSGIALKYYGSGTRDNWMRIYEANKEIIGADPGLIRVGQVFKIPQLPPA
jgi:nucleoid-associated protein YgaU